MSDSSTWPTSVSMKALWSGIRYLPTSCTVERRGDSAAACAASRFVPKFTTSSKQIGIADLRPPLLRHPVHLVLRRLSPRPHDHQVHVHVRRTRHRPHDAVRD